MLFGLLRLATEVGFRRGRVIQGRLDPAKSELTALQGAIVGLLAFTFTMAVES